MRPYLAVLFDSFNEALSSRVLWILIILSTMLLLVLAPIGFTEERAIDFSRRDVSNWLALIAKLQRQIEADERSPGKRISEIAGADFTKQVQDFSLDNVTPEQMRDISSTIENGFQKAIQDKQFYQEEDWKKISFLKNTKEWVEKSPDSLSKEDYRYRNRLILNESYRTVLNQGEGINTRITYLLWETEPYPMPEGMLEELLKTSLSFIMVFFVGVAAIFVGVLVTAPIIPRTFEPGAIDLLLSKPISRSFLFVTKFVGGCAFILLNASYFIIGLWLIMGFRFGIWNHKLLLCIPIFLFLFSIYYSVSAWAGVVWKNSIVCIVLSILFWAACFSVGFTKGSIEQFFLNPQQIVKIVKTDTSVVAVTQAGQFVAWEEENNNWTPILKSNNNRRPGPNFGFGQVMIGPVFDEQSKDLIFIQKQSRPGRYDFSGNGTSLSIANWNGTWQKKSGPKPPSGTAWLFLDDQGTLTTVGIDGISQIDAKRRAGQGGDNNFMGFKLPFGGSTPYEPLGPQPSLGLIPPFSAAKDPLSDNLIVFSRKKLSLLEKNEAGKYEEKNQKAFEDQEGGTALALGGKHLLVVFSDGKVVQFDRATFEETDHFSPAGKSEPYLAATSDDGRYFGVLFHNGTMWTLDTKTNKERTIRGDISSFAFVENEIWVADRITRITKYDIESLSYRGDYNPTPDTLLSVYWYGIKPLYTIFPKPGELGNVVNYLLMDKETVAIGPETNDLRSVRQTIDIWGPIINSSIFIFIMLAITCIYIERNDM